LQEHKNDLDMARINDYLSRLSLTTVKIFGLIFDLIGINSDKLFELANAKHGTHWMLTGDSKFNAKWRLYYRPYFDKYESA
jgi:hypothetical protein